MVFSSGGGAEGNGGGGGDGEATKTVSSMALKRYRNGWGRSSLRAPSPAETVAGETTVKRKIREKKEKGLGRAPMSESNRGMS